jgi:hypothetical protein
MKKETVGSVTVPLGEASGPNAQERSAMTNSLPEQARAKALEAQHQQYKTGVRDGQQLTQVAVDAAIEATLSLVEQEARRRLRVIDERFEANRIPPEINQVSHGKALAFNELADFCRHQREGS